MDAVTTPAEPDALAIIEEEARAVAQFFGIGAFEVAAQMLVGRVAGRLGGERVYVSLAPQRKERDAEIRRRFTGANHQELAREFECSVRQVRRIVARKAVVDPVEK
jgi:Mor family transcriptional regulator